MLSYWHSTKYPTINVVCDPDAKLGAGCGVVWRDHYEVWRIGCLDKLRPLLVSGYPCALSRDRVMRVVGIQQYVADLDNGGQYPKNQRSREIAAIRRLLGDKIEEDADVA